MSRFDYIKYDDVAIADQALAKKVSIELESMIESIGGVNNPAGAAAKQKAINKLEECYMWIGKAIRDDQINRNGSSPLQEDRNDDSFEIIGDTFDQQEIPF